MPPAATTSARRHHHGPCHRAATMGRDVRPVLGWTYNRVMRHGRGQSVKGGPLLSLFSDFGRQVHTVRGSHTLYVLAVPWCTVLRHLRAATSTARQYTVSTARADTLRSPIHRCHDHLAPLPPPRISSPSRRIHTTTAPAITAVTSTVTTPRPPPYSDHGAAQYHHGMYHVRGIQGRVRRGQRATAAAEPLASPQLLSTELAGGSRSEMGNMMRKCADATARSEFPTPMDSGAGGGRLVNAAKGPRPGTGPGRPRAMPRARAGGEILAAGDRPCVRALKQI